VKASGFGRVDFDVRDALKALYAANPASLMFGSDLPSTRAARAYSDRDFEWVTQALDPEGARRVLFDNARTFYHPRSAP
jgi:predicted TIM-barrel fold metal-dependent hydrolase